MGNGMARIEGKQGDRQLQSGLFPQILLRDLIPFIEAKYPVKTDREDRAMAGLSMGSYQTSLVTLAHPELFAWAGLFSGFLSFPRAPETHLAILDTPEKFNASFRVFYRAMGTEDQFFSSGLHDDEILKDKPVNVIRKTFPGGHDWGVWRRCIHDFLPMLFQDE